MFKHNSESQTLTVSFFGSYGLGRKKIIEQRLESILLEILDKYERVVLLVGKSTNYDRLVYDTVVRIKEWYHYNNCTLVLVLPCAPRKNKNLDRLPAEIYDKTEVCPESETTGLEDAIQIRNRKMMDRSDLILMSVEDCLCSYYQMAQYALTHKMKCINVAEDS